MSRYYNYAAIEFSYIEMRFNKGKKMNAKYMVVTNIGSNIMDFYLDNEYNEFIYCFNDDELYELMHERKDDMLHVVNLDEDIEFCKFNEEMEYNNTLHKKRPKRQSKPKRKPKQREY